MWDPQWSPIEAEMAEEREDVSRNALQRVFEKPARFGVMMMVMFSTLGGLALMVFGLGLQSEKPRSGWGALVTNVVMLAILLAAGVAMWTGDTSLLSRLWHALLCVVLALLLIFTIGALRQVLADPPSGALNVVPPDFDPKRDAEIH